MSHADDHDDFGGFQRDVPLLANRRRALQMMGGAGLAGLLVACGSDADSSASTTSTSTTSSTSTSTSTTAASSTTAVTSTTAGSATAGEEIPQETQGPYPADGSNGPNVLDTDGIVRSDITTSFGDMSGTADGIPTNIELTVVNAFDGSPIAGAAVYLWHCTATGTYSIYEETDQNYLRGVQEANDAGKVTFSSIFPGCYNGRWPHGHFEVYQSLATATNGDAAVRTSQLALPQADCEAAYADSAYGQSAQNLSRQSLSSDNVFRDGWESQLATVSGSATDGYTVSLLVRI